MRATTSLPTDYRTWLEQVKTTIRSTQIKAALAVNSELIQLYWVLGKMIHEKIQHAQWGEGIIKYIASDLKTEFPHLTGFSRDNLYFMLRFHRFYQDAEPIVEQLVQQIPWGHNILIFRKVKSLDVALQYPLKIGEKDYAIDLLFYHIRLHCFVVIDLKMTAFEPEHAGKMNFYLSAVDDLLKHETDNPSIGVILCKSKNRIEVEYALRDLNKPIGVSGWILTEKLPDNLQAAFPTIEQLEQELIKRLKKV